MTMPRTAVDPVLRVSAHEESRSFALANPPETSLAIQSTHRLNDARAFREKHA